MPNIVPNIDSPRKMKLLLFTDEASVAGKLACTQSTPCGCDRTRRASKR